jgi:hypothetical protein
VSVFPKVFGHYDSPDDQEHRHPRYQDHRGTNQMCSVPE